MSYNGPEDQHDCGSCFALRKEIAKLQVQLAAGPDKVLRCAFCGEAYSDGTPESKSQILANHIRVCEAHPVGRENRKLRAALQELSELGSVYVYPSKWDCAGMGGSPEIKDYEEVDIAGQVADRIASTERSSSET